MGIKALRVAALLLPALAGILGPAAADLEFYQEGGPKLTSEAKLERLVRLLEARGHSADLLREERLERQAEAERELELRRAQVRRKQQHLLELARQKQRGVLRDDLPERPNIIDALQREAVDPLEYVRELERQRLLPYLEYEAKHRPGHYSFEDEARARLMQAYHASRDPHLDYPELSQLTERVGWPRAPPSAHHLRLQPAFTYAFGEARDPELPAARPFAVAPNDPRFYMDQTLPGDPAAAEPSPQRPTEAAPTTSQPSQQPTTADSASSSVAPGVERQLLLGAVLPEPQRRAEQEPIVVALDHKAGNDIYFIATVAGFSAAAMFALVLISLTWCRLQRVSKAAADVEYPAYGVTGPNKDVSPSGDQRLAQSAQMYHFQHQKQQIIAMEKASAAREPGSVSEAESDEENEEGDYTVYECPGLAPTGEMEVKNPLFQDEPTPATPAKSKRAEAEEA